MTAQAGMATSRSIRRRRPLLAAAVLLLTVAVVARAQKPDLFDAPAPPSPPSALAEQKPVAPPTPPASTLPTEAAPAPSDAPAPETPAVPAVDVPPAPPAPPVPPVPSPPTPPVAPAPTQGEAAAAAVDSLALANTLGSHMVLQQAPLAACLYGTGAPLAVVQVGAGDLICAALLMDGPFFLTGDSIHAHVGVDRGERARLGADHGGPAWELGRLPAPAQGGGPTHGQWRTDWVAGRRVSLRGLPAFDMICSLPNGGLDMVYADHSGRQRGQAHAGGRVVRGGVALLRTGTETDETPADRIRS